MKLNQKLEKELEQKLKDAVWIAHSLFTRGKASGSSANMSFRHGDRIYISGSGTCFGTIKAEEFSVVSLDGDYIAGIKPSKEMPLHLMMYQKAETIQAVIHTHSFYSTIWSCMEHDNRVDCIPEYTPYLKMKVGTIGMVPYGKPGSDELFKYFKECVNHSDGFLLANHGPVVGGKSLFETFYGLEELEESARVAWEFNQVINNATISLII